MWIAVRDEPDEDDSYDHLPMVGGPFASYKKADEWIDGDDRFIAVERAATANEQLMVDPATEGWVR